MLKNFVKGKIKADTVCKKKCQGICGICMEEGECYSDARSSNFTNQDEVGSLLVCIDCLPLLNSDYRKRSFYITDKEAKHISQKDIMPILESIEFPCILSFTESNKKHRLFRSYISYSINDVYINVDIGYIKFDLEKDIDILHVLQDFYNKYKVSKEWMLTGQFPVNAIKKIGYDAYIEFERHIKPIRGSRKLGYFINFINKKDG